MMRPLIFLLTLLPFSNGALILGRQSCPSNNYKNIKIFWTEYASFYLHEDSNGTLSGIFPRIWKKALAQCCARLNYTFQKVEYDATLKNHAKAIDAIQVENDSMVVLFPALSSQSSPTVLTFFQFVPIKVSPGPMVLATKKSMEVDIDFAFFLPLWINPVFFLILAMTASAGVIFWVSEFRDKENKPNYSFYSFIREMGNSIWFSIVTMTTVGYGDIVPRYPLARFYAIFWMLIGIVLTSLFTAHISSAMTTLYITENKSLLGKKLGVLQGTRMLFENEINFGAMMSEYNEDDLFKALNEGNISRILLPDFLEALYSLSSIHLHDTDAVRIVDCIRHPFQFGIYIAAAQELNTGFLGCLSMSLNWYYLEDGRIDYSEIDDTLIRSRSIEVVTDHLVIRLTLYVLLISAVLLLLGVIVWIIRPRLQRRLSKTNADNNNA